MKLIYSFFLTSILWFGSLSAEELGELSNPDFVKMQPEALVIDIRTEQEWQQTGTIPNSHKLQFFSAEGKYDTDEWIQKMEALKTNPDQPVILVCRSGSRSSMVGNMLAKQLNMKNIYHLSNGIVPYIKTGNAIQKECTDSKSC
jgi:rhodanese-related sulfurtransferase